MTVATLFLVLALICFVVAAIGYSYRKVNLLGAGLACLVLAQLIGGGTLHLG